MVRKGGRREKQELFICCPKMKEMKRGTAEKVARRWNKGSSWGDISGVRRGGGVRKGKRNVERDCEGSGVH